MTSAQARLADTIDIFYGAADKSSESAMAAHAYKRAVEDLDTGVARELVRALTTSPYIDTDPPPICSRTYHTGHVSWSRWER